MVINVKKILFFLSLYTGKSVKIFLKIIGKRLPYYPGYLALKICPDFLNIINKPKLIIAVTGTNGKSTICGILKDFFESQNLRVINNKGFNIETGIASMFLNDVNLFGKSKSDIAIMEVDEKTTVNVFKYVKPNYYLCSNLFRDSMRGNSNIDYTVKKIIEGMPKDVQLILNADDLITVSIGDNNHNNIYFGIKEKAKEKSINHIITDLVYCPKCGSKLQFTDKKYFHIGNVKCPNCGYTNPDRDYDAKIDYKNNAIIVKHNNKSYSFHINVMSIFNIYNCLAAISLLFELGFKPEIIISFFEKMQLIDSRYSEEKIGKVTLINHMAKGQNPVACSSVFEYVKNCDGNKCIMLMLDDVMDRRNSSETIAWYYDTDFELFNDESVKKIIVAGSRSNDVYVRLLYAGIDSKIISIVKKEEDMASLISFKNIDKIFLLHDITLYDHSKMVVEKIRELGDNNDY